MLEKLFDRPSLVRFNLKHFADKSFGYIAEGRVDEVCFSVYPIGDSRVFTIFKRIMPI